MNFICSFKKIYICILGLAREPVNQLSSSMCVDIVSLSDPIGQVSDIFQFYTQRSSHEPRTIELEMVASSTSRSSASSMVRSDTGVRLAVAACVASLLGTFSMLRVRRIDVA